MDFGRKGDAKKAMKLHWKEGITLKQAWKKVLGKKSSKKKSVSPKKRRVQDMAKKAMKLHWKEGITLKQAWKKVQGKKSSKKLASPKKRRAQNMAKKAMKLKWKEGISLKQAWKKVNKFGDTVCPQGFEPNPNWAAGRGQRQCIKSCGFYQMRDASGRCRNMTMAKQIPMDMEINPETGRLRKICQPPNVRNQRGRCVAPKMPMVVKPGHEINPATGKQRKICQPGYYRDPVSGRCKKIKMNTEPLLISDMPVGLPPSLLYGKRFGTSCGSTFGKRCYCKDKKKKCKCKFGSVACSTCMAF